MKTKRTARQRVKLRACGRYLAALTVLFVCVCGALTSVRAGLSRLFSAYGSANQSLEASERALGFSPQDPEAHYARALSLEGAVRNQEALKEFEQAVALRPRDYFLWQELARLREAVDDKNGAIEALNEAIALAPGYAQPHWQLGNLLVRADQPGQGFAELRLAVNSDPSQYSAMIDLAWGLHEGDAAAVLALSRPRDSCEVFLLASLLVSRDRVNDAMELLRPTVHNLPPDDRASLTTSLIAAGRFSEAFEVWAAGRGSALAGTQVGAEKVFDGGFAGSIDANERGFGWKPTQATAKVHILLDPNSPESGQRSMRLEYLGGFDPAVPVVSQLVIVAPHTRYRLRFSARTQDLKSAASPLVAVREVNGNLGVLAQSLPLSDSTSGWQEFAIEFDAANSTAITINIQRQPCSSNPCPIFGRAWFDSFSLQRM